MKDLYEQLKETNYDIIRIIEPNNKQVIIIKDKEIENIEGSCCDYWKRGEAYNNYISMRVYKGEHMNDDYNKMDSNSLAILNSKIHDLRDTLNEMCISSDGTIKNKERLITSQYLDKLIVEYMKNTL